MVTRLILLLEVGYSNELRNVGNTTNFYTAPRLQIQDFSTEKS
jgi:hypothetical protein